MAHVLPKGVGEGLISGFADCTHSSYPDFKLSHLPKGVGEGFISHRPNPNMYRQRFTKRSGAWGSLAVHKLRSKRAREELHCDHWPIHEAFLALASQTIWFWCCPCSQCMDDEAAAREI